LAFNQRSKFLTFAANFDASMLTTILVAILISLSFQVFPVAIGIDRSKGFFQSSWFGSLLILGQILFFVIGYLLGDRFMHLMDGFKGIVIFIGFFLIGIRIIMEAFQVRKGERTYIIDNTKTAVLASVAQGINTFLAAMLFTFLRVDSQWLLMILVIASLIVTLTGLVIKPGRQGFAISSFLYLISSVVMIVSAVYLGFVM